MSVSDRSLIWNSDLIEALELENLLGNAMTTMHSAPRPQGKPRRARARRFPRARRRQLDEAHPPGVDDDGRSRIDYRPVNMQTLTNEVSVFPPKARVY
jgi:succinate dehydrogenase / fumarate reductase flavoprotein subunit